MEAGENTDSLWYFRDLKSHRISKLENFTLELIKEDSVPMNINTIKLYTNEFRSKFEHQKYYDSILISLNYDSLIYKTSMK